MSITLPIGVTAPHGYKAIITQSGAPITGSFCLRINMGKFSFRWGIPELDDGHTVVYNFMLQYYVEAGVTRDEFLCIVHLASYHYESPDGKSRPSQTRIAKELGYSHRNSVNNLLRSLKDKGMLITSGGKGFACEYNFAPFAKCTLELARKARDAHSNVQVGANPNVQVGANGHVHEEVKIKNKRTKKYKYTPTTQTAEWPEVLT